MVQMVITFSFVLVYMHVGSLACPITTYSKFGFDSHCLLAGVLSHYRGKGLGTMLVTSLLDHVACHPSTKVVYLHVLADNAPAIGKLNTCFCCSDCALESLV